MEHFYSRIKGWAAFTVLYAQMVAEARDGAHFVEIGSWLGRSAAFMAVEILNSGKRIAFECVDPWSDGGPDLRHIVQTMKEPIYEQFLLNTRPVGRYITPLRMASLDAAPRFVDASLDFVFLDGSHQYEDISADIAAWRPKVKPGGMLAGDDINWSGVNRAVQEAFEPGKFRVIDSGRAAKAGKPGNTSYWTARV